jgi:hypothetical protein
VLLRCLKDQGFAVDKAAQGQVFLRGLRFYPVSIIPQLLYTHSCIMCGMDSGPVSGRSSAETWSLSLLHNINSLLKERRTIKFLKISVGPDSPEVMILKWWFLTLSVLVLFITFLCYSSPTWACKSV